MKGDEDHCNASTDIVMIANDWVQVHTRTSSFASWRAFSNRSTITSVSTTDAFGRSSRNSLRMLGGGDRINQCHWGGGGDSIIKWWTDMQYVCTHMPAVLMLHVRHPVSVHPLGCRLSMEKIPACFDFFLSIL